MPKLENILDECVARLASGEATLGDCLTRYPEHADELRRLLTAATWLEVGREVRPAPIFKARARAQLLAHMKAKPRKQNSGIWAALLSFRFYPALSRSLNVAVGLAAILILFLSTGTVLAQSALPGESLYEWKLTSEQLLRTVHPDPLSVDLMMARRRTYDLAQVAGDPQAETVALEGYQQTLSHLSHYNEPEAQHAISEVLSQQKAVLAQAQVTVPELNQLLGQLETEDQVAVAVEPVELHFSHKVVTTESRSVTYNLTVTNTNSTRPVTATLVNSLSPAETLVSVSDDACMTASNGNVTCVVADLPMNKPQTITVTTSVEPCYSGKISNTAAVVETGGDTKIEPEQQIIAESRFDLTYPNPARVAYVQSHYGGHDLGLVSSTADMISESLHLKAAAPAWSPDGSQLAFFGVQGISELGGTYNQGNGVWLVDMVDSQPQNPKQLMAQDHIKSLAWSPDGNRLAVEVGIPSTNFEIVVIDANDGQVLSRFPGEQPAWSPDSQKLVIKSCQSDCGLWLVNADGSGGSQITFEGTDSYPDWSQSGEFIAFSSHARDGNWEIYLLDLTNNRITQVTHRPGTDTTPVFGPCGQEIYLRTDQYGSWWITAIKLDGSNEYKVKEGVGATTEWGLARPAVR